MPDSPLRRGDTVTTLRSRTEHTIEGLLGDGSGGFVYRTRTPDGGGHAVKLFKPSFMAIDPDTPARLRRLLDAGSPSPAFIWPQEAAVHRESSGSSDYGYSMALVSEAVPANRLFDPEDEGGPLLGPPLDIRVRAFLNLAEAVSSLHLRGLILKDLSGANVLVTVSTGAIAVLDCDSCDEPGRGGILGTPGYQAVESVADSRPQSQASDLHSLAVVGFELLTGSHPLRGQRWWQVSFATPEDLDDLFIHDPVFLFDPDDARNRPLSPQDDPFNECGGLASLWWRAYPRYVQELFTEAFTAGLRHLAHRVRASNWMMAAERFLDSLAPCTRCRQLNSIDVTWGDGPLRPCWKCESPVVDVPHLKIGDKRVALVPGRELFSSRRGNTAAASSRLPLVAKERTGTGELALKNLGPEQIRATSPEGKTLTLRPGQAVLVSSLPRGTRLQTSRAVATLVKQ